MKNKYFEDLLEMLKQAPENGEHKDYSSINFTEAYDKWKVLPEEEMLQYGRELYLFDTEFRELMNDDTEAKIKLANYRKLKIEGLNVKTNETAKK